MRPVSKNPLLTSHNNFNLVNVGGVNSATDRSKKYINNQTDIINKSNQYVPQTYVAPYKNMELGPDMDNRPAQNDANVKRIRNIDETRFDEYTYYLYQNGLIDRDNNVRFDTWYINIDSRFRQKTPILEHSDSISVVGNKIKLIEKTDQNLTSEMRYTVKNHSFRVGDQISISGITGKTFFLRTINDIIELPITFATNFDYLKIYHKNITDVTADLYNGIVSGIPWINFDERDLQVELSGFQGTAEDDKFIGNIPINFLNNVHRIYLSIREHNIAFNPDIFYIKLPKIFECPTTVYHFSFSYNITIKLLYICGVPTNLINTKYPITK